MREEKREKEVEAQVRSELFAMQDTGYRDFNSKLIPTVDPETVIGVRTPKLRAFAKTYAKMPEAQLFMECLPHHYYEENNLHAFLVEQIRDYETCVAAAERFLPYVDNWATCDQMSPKVFRKHREELLAHIRVWLASAETYTVRYGIGMLMSNYLDEAFAPEYPAMVAAVQSDEYYVKMMAAWYFATALAKQWETVIPYIEENRLPVWTHNKAIQKAIESRRISEEQKRYLRTFKR